jgi:acylphosphatase
LRIDGFRIGNSAIQALEFLMAAQTITRRYVVTGRVQGVGFRWFVEREARTLGLGGWVRNRANGSVEVLASGTNQQLNALYDKLKQGPRAARVDNVEVEEAASVKDAGTFRIEGAW